MFTLLCIDDEPSINLLHKIIFEAHGYRVLSATDGSQNLLLFRSERVDLVITDYRMPGMTGADVAEELRSINAHLPIIMLSGYMGLPDDVRQNVDQYFIKGLSPPDVILKAVESLLARDRNAAKS